MRNVPNVVVAIAEEFAQNVDSHHTQPTVRLDLQDGQDSFVEYRVPYVLR